jgi:hypothetical protein
MQRGCWNTVAIFVNSAADDAGASQSALPGSSAIAAITPMMSMELRITRMHLPG